MAHARLIYADSEASADLFYATRFFAPDPFLFLQTPNGETHIVVSSLEIDRARRTSTTDAVHNFDAIKSRWQTAHPDQTGSSAKLILFFLQEQGIHQLKTPSNFPLLLADQLRAGNIDIQPDEQSFWPQRAIKTPEEIAFIETALEITASGMATAIEMIRTATIGLDNQLMSAGTPLTSERVRGEIHATLVRSGAAPHHTIVAGGGQGADPHEEGSGTLYAHQPIILDIFPRMEKSGYWGDMTRTVCRGTPPQRLSQAWEAVKAAQEIAFKTIRHGASGAAIHAAVTDTLTQAGFVTSTDAQGRQGGFFHGTGHGLGLEIHEAPRISSRDEILQAGHVVTVEPGLYYPEMGGVRLEDVVVVEATGCRNLTRSPKFLEV